MEGSPILSPETAFTLMLDMEHLTDYEKAWLHELKNRVQCRIIRKYVKEKECLRKQSSHAPSV